MPVQVPDTQLALDLAPRGEPAIVVRHSRRARRMQIKVSPWRGVEVVVPPRHSTSRVQRFVAENRNWIQTTWREIQASYPEAGRVPLPTELYLAALDKNWKLSYQQGTAGNVQERSPGLLCITSPANDRYAAISCLRDWLGTVARRTLVPWLATVAQRTGLSYKRVQIRGQRSRWGSCSARGTIALNYKLLFVKPAVVEYLLIHELCHTRQLNHSHRFWSLVEKFEPHCRRLDRMLGDSWQAVPAWVEVLPSTVARESAVNPETNPETIAHRI